MSKTYVGIDYSITGPAMCVHKGNKWSLDNCSFLFLDARKKHHCEFFVKEGVKAIGKDVCKEYVFDVNRFLTQANEFIAFLKDVKNIDKVAIEGYAYGARGKVFNIGENTGLLKHRIIEEGYRLEILQPGEIKKAATGKGNANKQAMYEAWFKETGVNLSKLMDCASDKGPVNDVVDAYYICKRAWENDNGKD